MQFDLLVNKIVRLYEGLSYEIEIRSLEKSKVNFVAMLNTPGIGRQKYEVYCFPQDEDPDGKNTDLIAKYRKSTAEITDDSTDGTILVCTSEQYANLSASTLEHWIKIVRSDDLGFGRTDFFANHISISTSIFKDAAPFNVYLRTKILQSPHSHRKEWMEARAEWLEDQEKPSLLITGDKRSGKSILLRAMAAQHASEIISGDRRDEYVFFVTADDILSTNSILEAILRSVSARITGAVVSDEVEQILRSRLCTVYLENIDFDPTRGKGIFSQISELVLDQSARAVATCSSTFVNKTLRSATPIDVALRFNSWQTAGLNVNELRRRIGEFRNEMPEEVAELLNDHAEFTDIVSLILCAQKAGAFKPGDAWSFALIFNAAIFECVHWELKCFHGKEYTFEEAREDLVSLAVRCAYGSKGIPFLASALRRGASLFLGTLLSLSENNEISFNHDEFFACLAAEYFVERMLRDDREAFSDGVLLDEVIYSIASWDIDRLALTLWLREGSANSPTSLFFYENIGNILQAIRTASGERVPNFSITNLKLRNIRCFESADISFIGTKSDGAVNLIVGDNGAGKSTILKCIALCALGPDLASRIVSRPASLLRHGAEKGLIWAEFVSDGIDADSETTFSIALEISASSRSFSLKTDGDLCSTNHERFLELRDDTAHSGLFVSGYGASRNFDSLEDSVRRKDEDPLIDRVKSLFDPFKLLVDPDGLERLISGDGSGFAAFDAPTSIPPAVRLSVARILLQLLPSGDVGDFDDFGRLASVSGPVAIADLSDGYRSTLAWASHLVISVLSGLSWSAPVDDVRGILLIDEVDLHLHPQWQRVILEQVVRIFPNLQIVVTTHSPLVVSGLSPENGRLMLCRTSSGAAEVVVYKGDFAGWRFDQVLASEVFGYLIDRDPRTERVLREASILHSKGGKRTPEEERRYLAVIEIVSGLEFGAGQTIVERAGISEARRSVSEEVLRLEQELFGDVV